jgi:hypothetical protein
MTNPYSTEVFEDEIAEGYENNPIGDRLTKVACKVCHFALTERELFTIRDNVSAERHWNCINPLTKDFHLMGYDVRDTDENDKVYEATKDLTLGSMQVRKGYLLSYNGKSAIIRPVGYAEQCDEETNHPSVEIAIRRGWLKPWVKPEDKPINKVVKSVSTKGKWMLDTLKRLGVETLDIPTHLIGRPPKNNTPKE